MRAGKRGPRGQPPMRLTGTGAGRTGRFAPGHRFLDEAPAV